MYVAIRDINVPEYLRKWLEAEAETIACDGSV